MPSSFRRSEQLTMKPVMPGWRNEWISWRDNNQGFWAWRVRETKTGPGSPFPIGPIWRRFVPGGTIRSTGQHRKRENRSGMNLSTSESAVLNRVIHSRLRDMSWIEITRSQAPAWERTSLKLRFANRHRPTICGRPTAIAQQSFDRLSR